MKDTLLNLETFYAESHAMKSEGFKAKRTIQHIEDGSNAIATVKVTPTFVCNSVKLREVHAVVQPMKANSDSEMPGSSTGDKATEEKTPRKVTRNTSNGSKRKVRLRRMGSRQSSKTESDTEEEQTANPDVSRKVKRKTSRAKKQVESDKSFDNFQAEDEVVYVFKIKPGEKNEVTVKPIEIMKPKISETPKSSVDETILISPIENSIQIIEPNHPTSQNLFTNAIVKTRRKIFTPVEVQDGTVNTTISQEIESSSASDKNDNDKITHQLVFPLQSDNESYNKVSTLPPLPSPKCQRKHELTKQNSGKDLSPSIKLMIDRYNSSVDKKTNSPNSSGSCSPIWRSPILDRRVQKQSAEYQDKLQKSSSFQEINDDDEKKAVDDPEKSNADESSTETIIEPRKVSDKGAIPKEPIASPIEKSFSDTVTMRNDTKKPRTPLSERAMKIQQAKEAFLKMPLISHDSSGNSDWTYRLSQISVGSTDSFTDNCSLIKCLSAGVLPDKTADQEDTTSIETKSSSLPRNSKHDSENVSESSRGSRFNLSSLATKLRKVKLKRNTKEVKKMNTVPVLCRQSIAVDFSAGSSQSSPQPPDLPIGPSRFRKNKYDSIKKSKSLGILGNE